MKTNTELKPLAERITKARHGYEVYKAENAEDPAGSIGVCGDFDVAYCKIPHTSNEEIEANAELIAEAFNTTQACGMTPAQLLELSKEMHAALKMLGLFLDDLSGSNPGYLGKLCLQDYALMNEAFMALDRTIARGETLNSKPQ